MGVTKRVSVAIALALIVGWGGLGLFLIQAKVTAYSADTLDQPPVVISPSVRLRFQIDKSIYRSNDTILLALRNDSRKPIWMTEHMDGCADSWWQIHRLEADGETWARVAQTKQTCSTATYGTQSFPKHTLLTGQWVAQVPGPQIGDVVTDAPQGTYRIAAKYVAALQAPTETTWANDGLTVVSSIFTIQ